MSCHSPVIHQAQPLRGQDEGQHRRISFLLPTLLRGQDEGQHRRISFLLTHSPDLELPDCSRIEALDCRQERRAQVSADTSLLKNPLQVLGFT